MAANDCQLKNELSLKHENEKSPINSGFTLQKETDEHQHTHLFWPLVVFQQHSWVHVEYFCFSSCHQHPLTFFPGFMMKKNALSPSNLQEEDLICCEWCLAVELATTFSKRPHRLHPSSCHMTCTSCIEGSDVCCRPPAFP